MVFIFVFKPNCKMYKSFHGFIFQNTVNVLRKEIESKDVSISDLKTSYKQVCLFVFKFLSFVLAVFCDASNSALSLFHSIFSLVILKPISFQIVPFFTIFSFVVSILIEISCHVFPNLPYIYFSPPLSSLSLSSISLPFCSLPLLLSLCLPSMSLPLWYLFL